MRKQFNTVMFGGNGCGKTTFLLEIIDNYLTQNTFKRVLLICPDDSEEKLDFIEEIEEGELPYFSGIKKICTRDVKIFDRINKLFLPENKAERDTKPKFNGLLIIDDAGVILNRRDECVLDLFRRRRQANADIITIFHGLRNEVPPSFFAYTSNLIIFQTADNPKKTLELLPPAKQAEFLTIYNRVQKNALKNPYYKEELILRPFNE